MWYHSKKKLKKKKEKDNCTVINGVYAALAAVLCRHLLSKSVSGLGTRDDVSSLTDDRTGRRGSGRIGYRIGLLPCSLPAPPFEYVLLVAHTRFNRQSLP